MHIQTHFLLSWLIADRKVIQSNRDLLIITLCGVVPDLDGLGILIDVDTYHRWHHTIGHSLFTGVAIFFAIWLFLKSIRVAVLASFSYNLHLLCDYLGSAGSDGYIWPIYLLWPFHSEKFLNPYQWELASPINVVITLLALMAIMYRASNKGYSPFILCSRRIDQQLVKVFKKWFGKS